MKWAKASDLETKIILTLLKGKSYQSKVAKDINHDSKSVGKTITRMEDQGLIETSKDYSKDARVRMVRLDKKKIKIKRTHDFYKNFFFIQIITIFLSVVLSIFMRRFENSPLIWISACLSIIPSTIYMSYKAYITKDRITVEKLVYQRGKYNKKKKEDKVEDE